MEFRLGLFRSVFYGVMSVSPYGEGDRNERNLKAVYKAAGWELQDERYLQMAGLLAVMPLTMANGPARDFERLKRFRTMLTTTDDRKHVVDGKEVPVRLNLGGARKIKKN